jgi:hypothetical protein
MNIVGAHSVQFRGRLVFLGYDIVWWWGRHQSHGGRDERADAPFGIHVFVLKTLASDMPMAAISRE